MEILYADGSRFVQETVARVLRDLGHTVILFESAQELWKYLCRKGASDDNAIVTSNNFSELTGLQLLKQLKEDPRFNDLPVIVLTGDSLQAETEALGGTFLQKPVRKTELTAAIEEAVRQQKPPSS